MFSMRHKKDPVEYFSFKTFGKLEDRVVFFFTAFRTKYWLYYPTIKFLTNAGYYVIVYDIDASMIFHGEVADFLKVTEALVEDVKQQVSSLKKQGAKAFFSYGVSMGTILAMRTAIEIADIKKIVAN